MFRGILFLIFPILSLPAEIVTLQVDPNNSSTTTYQTDNGISVSTVTATGTIEVDLEFDPVTRKPTEVTFTGGTLFYSDSTSVYTPDSLPPVESLIITNLNNEGHLASLRPNSPIDPLTGFLTNEDHTTSLTKGTFNIEFDIIFLGNQTNFFSSTTDFAVQPQVTGFSGQTTLTSSLIQSGAVFDTYEINFTTVSDSTPQDLRDQGIALTLIGEGGYSANGLVQFPSADFLAWSGQHLPGNESPAILYALGFGPEQQQVPLTISPTSATLTLPAGGTRAPVIIQHSQDLHTWTAIQTVPVNSDTSITIDITESGERFFRLLVE